MKSMIFLFSIVLSFISDNSQARSMIVAQEANLYGVRYDDTVYNSGTGLVFVDHFNKEITVTLKQKPFFCPPTAMCSLPQTKVLKATLVSGKKGTCGKVIYTGNGTDLKISIVDWRGYNCFNREHPAADTIVTTLEAWLDAEGEAHVYKGTFLGDKLSPTAPRRADK